MADDGSGGGFLQGLHDMILGRPDTITPGATGGNMTGSGGLPLDSSQIQTPPSFTPGGGGLLQGLQQPVGGTGVTPLNILSGAGQAMSGQGVQQPSVADILQFIKLAGGK
jgi:hypothetical protein